MAYQICGRCKKMFEKNTQFYCGACSEKNQKDYALITGYLRDNPGATIMGIIQATGASLKSINCFIDDGSLSYVENRITTKTFNKYEDVELKTQKAGKFHTRRSR